MAVQIPFSTTVTSHGLLIQANRKAVGAITSWGVRQNATRTPVFEFGNGLTTGYNDVPARPGEPYEVVPGNIGGTTISIRRYDIYTDKFESAFGTRELEMLTDQDQPSLLREFWTAPDTTLNFTNVYYGFWFQDLGKEMTADGNRVVMANATGIYSRRRAA